jgi:hypothetical protein
MSIYRLIYTESLRNRAEFYFMIVESDRGCSTEWPRRQTDGLMRERWERHLRKTITIEYQLSLIVCTFFLKFYIDISARQARRRESVNKMNVLYLPKNLNMKQEKSNLIYLYTRFGEILCRAFIFLFKIHPRPLWKSSSSLFFIWEWIQKDLMSTATKENQHSKNFPQKFSFFFFLLFLMLHSIIVSI